MFTENEKVILNNVLVILEKSKKYIEGLFSQQNLTKIFNSNDFVLIQPGHFMMGSPESETERKQDETLHIVQITKPFYMQTTTVTQGQWKLVMDNNPSHFKDSGDDCPVERVSWNDVQEFIKELNKQEVANIYRLPTEAEWEYACRAGTTTPFAFGKCLATEQVNYNGRSSLGECPEGKYQGRTIPVGKLKSNKWGLYDMHGNVWEWVQDWHGDYPSESVVDPVGPESGSVRVYRGGSWYNTAAHCRSAYRDRGRPAFRHNHLGFRIVKEAK